ncbi:vitamin B12-dependent ribonucleotide reductase [Ruminococcaceae bacterium OttesenSCG-928-D13]|nr:vitamin B12-dependent ribonucleotide reductase [Ruminococcaceae bacterium OttesenSCG-928-D13]
MEINDTARQILKKRYLAKDENGKVTEDVDGLFRRVAKAVAAADDAYPGGGAAGAEQAFYELMTELRFLPNSPTLMNAGRPLGQLSACFVLPVEDSMEGIFDALKSAALIHKSGGGTGFSFSRLRPNGSPVGSTGGVASGPVSFMRVFNMATEAVKQGGTRRGANMGILRVDHPDILEFIDCKKNNADITNFNISVGITERFMQAVEAGVDYDLTDPHNGEPAGSLNARAVFDKIVDAAWRNGEPGIIFLDRLNRDNPVPGEGEIESTNPCGEQPLLPFESCNLGSINLVKMLKEGENGPEIDWDLLANTTADAVHFLDNVIDINNYPLPEIAEKTRSTRKIGLGVMGFADMLLLLGIPYNSEQGLDCAERVMGFIQAEGRRASRALAKARGPFPLFAESIFKDGEPLRNATVTTIAPTGTLSIIAGVSGGVEPVFAYAFVRNIMDGAEFIEASPVLERVLKERGLYSEELMRKISAEGAVSHIEELPEELRAVFVSAHDVSPLYHIRMQAAFQQHTDNAVSKTVNFPGAATKEEVAEVYKLAYLEGCKGVTIYRDGSRDSQVLNAGGAALPSPDAVLAGMPDNLQPYGSITPRPRPEITTGFTEKMKIGCGNLYVTVNYDENGICEVFTSTGKAGGCPSQSEATARLCSVALRSGMSVREVCDQLRGIRCPSTIRQPGMNCTSCPDAIAKVVMKVNDYIEAYKDGNGGSMGAGLGLAARPKADEPSDEPAPAQQEKPVAAPPPPRAAKPKKENPADTEEGACPDCGAAIQHEGGCTICRNCGYSRCG